MESSGFAFMGLRSQREEYALSDYSLSQKKRTQKRRTAREQKNGIRFLIHLLIGVKERRGLNRNSQRNQWKKTITTITEKKKENSDLQIFCLSPSRKELQTTLQTCVKNTKEKVMGKVIV